MENNELNDSAGLCVSISRSHTTNQFLQQHFKNCARTVQVKNNTELKTKHNSGLGLAHPIPSFRSARVGHEAVSRPLRLRERLNSLECQSLGAVHPILVQKPISIRHLGPNEAVR